MCTTVKYIIHVLKCNVSARKAEMLYCGGSRTHDLGVITMSSIVAAVKHFGFLSVERLYS